MDYPKQQPPPPRIHRNWLGGETVAIGARNMKKKSAGFDPNEGHIQRRERKRIPLVEQHFGRRRKNVRRREISLPTVWMVRYGRGKLSRTTAGWN